jgi:hypothetical protein
MGNPLDAAQHTRVVQIPIKRGAMGPATIIVNQQFKVSLLTLYFLRPLGNFLFGKHSLRLFYTPLPGWSLRVRCR